MPFCKFYDLAIGLFSSFVVSRQRILRSFFFRYFRVPLAQFLSRRKNQVEYFLVVLFFLISRLQMKWLFTHTHTHTSSKGFCLLFSLRLLLWYLLIFDDRKAHSLIKWIWYRHHCWVCLSYIMTQGFFAYCVVWPPVKKFSFFAIIIRGNNRQSSPTHINFVRKGRSIFVWVFFLFRGCQYPCPPFIVTSILPQTHPVFFLCYYYYLIIFLKIVDCYESRTLVTKTKYTQTLIFLK
jgi:hypothetical protein